MIKAPKHCDDVLLCCNCASNRDCGFYQYIYLQLNGIEDEKWDIDWDKVIKIIDDEVKMYEVPTVYHDEIWNAPMRF